MIRLNDLKVQTLRESIQAFGFGVLDRCLTPEILEELQREAAERSKIAQFAQQDQGLRYRASMTSLGGVARDLLSSEPLIALLEAVFGDEFELTEDRSCMTFYGPGDTLGPHLDKPAEECVVTIIVYVTVEGPAFTGPTGCELRVYGRELPPSSNGVLMPRLIIPSVEGSIVLGHGSQYWHERPGLQPDEYVVALTGCYHHAQRTA